MRAIESRVREFDVLFGFLKSPVGLESVIRENPSGSRCELEGIVFEFGNIFRLLPALGSVTPTSPFSFKPKFACHVVNLDSQRKVDIENEFGLRQGSLSSKGSKVNLLLVDQRNKPYFISYRRDIGQAKLGQVSTSKKYQDARLDGGLGDAARAFNAPLTINYKDTVFEELRFNKLGPQDQELAYIKNVFSTEWNSYCVDRLQYAINQVKQLGKSMTKNKNVFIDFLSQTFAGQYQMDENFYLLIGDQVVEFQKVLEKLMNTEFRISTEVYRPRDKESLIVNIEIDGKTYCVTKIEPSFDGASLEAEQTKGIVFYFQQHQKSGNNYKQLLIDIAK